MKSLFTSHGDGVGRCALALIHIGVLLLMLESLVDNMQNWGGGVPLRTLPRTLSSEGALQSIRGSQPICSLR